MTDEEVHKASDRLAVAIQEILEEGTNPIALCLAMFDASIQELARMGGKAMLKRVFDRGHISMAMIEKATGQTAGKAN